MRKRYYRTGTVIFSIFLIAVIAVIAVFIFIYQKGLRYIKSDAGIKYFGTVDKNGDIVSGRLWFENDAADIDAQKFFIAEIRDYLIVPDISVPVLSVNDIIKYNGFDFIDKLNNILSPVYYYPLDNFLFGKSDDAVFFRSETFDEVIKEHEKNKNNIISGEIYDSDGVKWILVSENNSPSSYKNFEVANENNQIKKYKGDVLSFIKKEDIDFASFVLKDETVINLYAAKNLYRINYDKGSRAGELYIGGLNRSFEKNGTGLYYNNGGDIYFGDFINDEKNGNCALLCYGGDIYEGEIKDGKRNGAGYYKWREGDSYSGEFKDNMKNGFGINKFADGSVYEGEYKNDIKQGRGKYILSNGDIYEGDFVNDSFIGKGMYIWASGEYYEGDFDRNMHGWGTYYWTTGRTYEGWWDMGKMVLDKPSEF